MSTVEVSARLAVAGTVADAVLYEGYLLYPYRRSSVKNRVRWQFGVLAPREWIAARGAEDTGVAGSADSWFQQSECLLEPGAARTVHVRVRFLRAWHRSVVDSAGRPVDELDVDGRRYLSFDEAEPYEFDLTAELDALGAGEDQREIGVPGGERTEPLGPAGRLVYRSWPLSARVTLSTARADAPFPLLRLTARIENTVTGAPPDLPRAEALRHSLLATHALLGLDGGRFVSLLEPPEWAAAAAKACRNVHVFPVLAGEPGEKRVLLCSPILMYDHPQVSPESPADLFDATEIDEILSLRALTLTEEEKQEARATDPRAAALVDRVDAMPPEVMERLHGAVRTLRPVAPEEHDESAGSPPVPAEARRDVVVVAGVRVGAGSRVRLRPRTTGTDVHDMFLAGRAAKVQAVLLDTEDARHVAVTLEDDPGADLHQWYGRFYYFAPDELTPLDDPAEEG